MLIYICTGCGRFGSLPTPEEATDAKCVYCGNGDIDWLSRPDLDAGFQDNGEGFMCLVEKDVLKVLGKAYDSLDDTGISPATKKAVLEELHRMLSQLVAQFFDTES